MNSERARRNGCAWLKLVHLSISPLPHYNLIPHLYTLHHRDLLVHEFPEIVCIRARTASGNILFQALLFAAIFDTKCDDPCAEDEGEKGNDSDPLVPVLFLLAQVDDRVVFMWLSAYTLTQ